MASIPTDPSFAAAVRPYLAQLLSLPQALLEVSPPSLDGLASLYQATNPFVSGLGFALALSPLFLATSTVTGTYAVVDRAWSILPGLFQAHYWAWACLHGLPTERLSLATAATVLWSARLTHNFWRKGGYSAGAEDYRWDVVRRKITNPLLLFVFNALFVSTWQTVVLFMVTAPGYLVSIASISLALHAPPCPPPPRSLRRRPADPFPAQIDSTDWAFFAALLGILVVEGVADEQQWKYQQAKRKRPSDGAQASGGRKAQGKPPRGFPAADLQRGFPTHGLWAYSRHPNVAAEQAFWIVLYLWSAMRTWKLSLAARGPALGLAGLEGLFNWALVGTGLYLLPFNDSTKLTESISATKYPQYAEYQRQVGCFLPRLSFLWGGGKWKGAKTA